MREKQIHTHTQNKCKSKEHDEEEEEEVSKRRSILYSKRVMAILDAVQKIANARACGAFYSAKTRTWFSYSERTAQVVRIYDVWDGICETEYMRNGTVCIIFVDLVGPHNSHSILVCVCCAQCNMFMPHSSTINNIELDKRKDQRKTKTQLKRKIHKSQMPRLELIKIRNNINVQCTDTSSIHLHTIQCWAQCWEAGVQSSNENKIFL